MAPLRSISELASIVERNTRALEEALKGTDAGQFSIALGAQPVNVPPSLTATRTELLDTIDELNVRLLGPMDYLMTLLLPAISLSGILKTLYTFDIASHVPPSDNGEISYADLAKSCGLPEEDLRRIVQAAITFRIFEEVSPDLSVKHNAISAAFAAPQLKDLIGMMFGEQLSGMSKFAESLRRYPGSGEPGHSAAVLAFREEKMIKESGFDQKEVEDPSKTFFDYLAEDPSRVARFRSAMAISNKSAGYRSSYFVDNLPWADKDQCPETIADIGGAGGDLCQGILRAYPGVKKAVILDLPEVVADARAPEDLRDRLEYASYNFFTQEVTRQADAYVFRHIFHDWSDQYALKILKNLVPALRKGTKIWLCEVVLPNLSDNNRLKSRLERSADILMKAGFNGKERSRRDWETLLAAADERLRIVNITTPEGAQDSIIEIVFDA